jgi:hypothetical protein
MRGAVVFRPTLGGSLVVSQQNSSWVPMESWPSHSKVSAIPGEVPTVSKRGLSEIRIVFQHSPYNVPIVS